METMTNKSSSVWLWCDVLHGIIHRVSVMFGYWVLTVGGSSLASCPPTRRKHCVAARTEAALWRPSVPTEPNWWVSHPGTDHDARDHNYWCVWCGVCTYDKQSFCGIIHRISRCLFFWAMGCVHIALHSNLFVFSRWESDSISWKLDPKKWRMWCAVRERVTFGGYNISPKF